MARFPLTQQLFAQFLITIILLASVPTLFLPSRAKAGALVFETNPALIAHDFQQVLKDFGLDAIVFALSGVLLQNMANQTLAWVQGGQTPSFIRDWQGFFLSAGSLAYTEFTNRYFLPQILPNVDPSYRGLLQAYIQSPFNPLDTDLSQLTRSTLQAFGVTPGMVTTYARDFQSGGGWRTFEALSQPNNSFYNVYLQTLNAQARTIASSIEANKAKIAAGSGFIDKTNPATGETKTPGATIRDTLNTALAKPFGKLEAADEIAEFLTAFLLSAFNRVLSQGLR